MPALVRRTSALVLTTPALAALIGCSGGEVKQTVSVTATDTACTLGSTTLQAGRTKFEVHNDSGREAEAYVYDADGDKVDEVEGIADGTSRTLTVSLDAGDYEFACKPEGDDVRTDFTVE